MYTKKYFVFILLLLLVACSTKSKKDLIVGKWRNGGGVIIFSSDSVSSPFYGSSRYKVDGDSLYIYTAQGWNAMPLWFSGRDTFFFGSAQDSIPPSIRIK